MDDALEPDETLAARNPRAWQPLLRCRATDLDGRRPGTRRNSSSPGNPRAWRPLLRYRATEPDYTLLLFDQSRFPVLRGTSGAILGSRR